MFTRFQTASLLAASLAGTARAVSRDPNLTYSPIMTLTQSAVQSTDTSVSTTSIVSSSSTPGFSLTVSTTGTSVETLPTAAAQHGIMQKSSGFSASLKKSANTTTSNAKRELQARDETWGTVVEYSWLVALSVGTPEQEMEFSLDVGSPGFVVFSTLEPEDVRVVDYPIYDPENSTTAKTIAGYSWEMTYGGFSLEGDIYTDVVTIGSSPFSNMTMEVATDEPTGSTLTTASGILGLCNWATVPSTPEVPSFLGQIVDALEDGLFSIWFNSTVNEEGIDGTIDFGYIDDSKYTGDIVYSDVTDPSGPYWEITISGIGAADPETGALLSSNMTSFTTIVDTGSDQSYMPAEALWGWYGAIDGVIYDEGGYCYDYPCSANTSLPDLVLFIGDGTVVVPRKTYAYWETMNPANGVDGIDYCTQHVRPNILNGGSNMFGQDLIEGLFSVYDFTNQRVGFGNTTANNDKNFYIPGAATPPDTSGLTCTWSDPTTVADTVINPHVTGCTGADFTGTCYDIEVSEAVCAVVDDLIGQVSLGSFMPNETSNLRCTLYSDNGCATVLTDATNVVYPGVSSLNSTDDPQSIFCVSEAIQPETTPNSLLDFCGLYPDGTTQCGQADARPWHCSIKYAPSTQFQVQLIDFWTVSGNTIGTCWWYSDEYCVDLISNVTGIDACDSDKYGDSISEDLGTYIGSSICI